MKESDVSEPSPQIKQFMADLEYAAKLAKQGKLDGFRLSAKDLMAIVSVVHGERVHTAMQPKPKAPPAKPAGENQQYM